MVRDEHCPFVQRQRDLTAAQTASLVQPALDLGSTISVHASIGRIGQHVMHRAECSAAPADRILVHTPVRQQHAFLG
jgi:hypothetical protein